MRVHHIQNILGLLSGALLSPYGVYANTHAALPSLECSIQAWVRAPDLATDTVVQGDARLKLNAGCTTLRSASLGLRFKERSFVKASRSVEATKRLEGEPSAVDPFDPERVSPSSPWVLPAHNAINCSTHVALAEVVKNKDLWLVREEERIVFESTQAIDVREAQPGSVQDVVQDFAILVPSTNFPPALDYPRSRIGLREGEFLNVEAMYEYFVRVAFENGTTVELPAGFTAFHPRYDTPNNNLVQSKTVQLQTTQSLEGSLVDDDPVANYTAEITSEDDGFGFFQGSDDQFVKVAITRTGRARTFDEPLELRLCIDSSLSPKWASEHTSDPNLQSLHKPNQILRATSADFKPRASPSTSRCVTFSQGHVSDPKPLWMPNATSDQIAAGEIVTTTSKPVQFLIDADSRHATDFETYYFNLSSKLFLSLDVQRTQDEPHNPTNMFGRRAMRKKTPEVDADEESWVPWHSVPEVTSWRGPRTYMGNVSVSVYPMPRAQVPTRCTHVQPTFEQVIVASNTQDVDCTLPSPVHYLAEGARAPTFVDNDATNIQALLSKTLAGREAVAPLLEPVVSTPLEGEERVHRYYRVPEGHRPLIYVGETWVKKVTHKDEHKISAPRPDSMPDALNRMVAAMRHVFDEL